MPFWDAFKPAPGPDVALNQLRDLCARLANPYWMRNPRSWVWSRGDGLPQGFGFLAGDRPGMANLLWLSMEQDVPPKTYEATKNPLYVLLFQQAEFARLDGQPLTDMAALLPLREFAERLPAQLENKPSIGAERAYPLLKLLAERRLQHADT